MRVNTNVNSLVAMRNLNTANSAVSDSMGKLSTGFRINRAADDAAGLGIANQLRANTRSLVQSGRNAEQANSVLQIAEGSTSTIQKMLERMKELATQAASDTVDDAGRGRLQTEFSTLVDEIDRTVDTTKFQGTKLLDGDGAGERASFTFMVSSSQDYGAQDNISVSLSSLKTSVLGMRQAGATVEGGAPGTAAPTASMVTPGGPVADASVKVRFGGGHGGHAASSSISGGTGDAPSLSGTANADGSFKVRYETSAVAQAGLANDGTISAGSAVAATASGTLQLRVDAGALQYNNNGSWDAITDIDPGATYTAGDGEFTFNGVKFSVADASNGDTFEVATSAAFELSTDDGVTWGALPDGGGTQATHNGVTVNVSGASRISGEWTIETKDEVLAQADAWQMDSGNGYQAMSGMTATIGQVNGAGGVEIDVTDAAQDGTEFTISSSANNGKALSLGGLKDAQTTLAAIDTAIGKVNEQLGDIGAAQNRIDYATQNVKTAIVNQTAAESVIRDLDMADEMTKFSKNNIISQAATAMLAQANQSTQGVLQLLRG